MSKSIEIVCILFCVDIGIPYFGVLLYFSCEVISFNILVHVLTFPDHIYLNIKSSNSLKCALLSKAGKKNQEILSYKSNSPFPTMLFLLLIALITKGIRV